MRRRLIVVAGAISLMVAIAFLVPLIVLVRTVARDRAITNAERDANAMTPTIALNESSLLSTAAARTDSGRDNRMTIVLPTGQQIGTPIPDDDDLALARGGTSFSASRPGGTAVFQVVDSSAGRSVVRVWVPDSLLTNGVSGATVTLVGLGVILVVGAIAVSDRLGASMVRPVRRLAGAAVRLSEGDLEQRVEPEGPKEVAAVGQAFNLLADRVGDLLAAERELVADLSHRLRTPLTVLRLEADSVPDPAARARISAVAVELEDAVTALIAEARRPITANVQQPADLAAVTADRVAFWNALAEDQSRPVDSDIASGPIMVGVPAIELEAALDVLLGNVFEHTPDGTRFAVTLQRVDDGDDHGAVVHVDDAGSGFDPERVHRGRSGRDSSGLGLDIARRTVERAGGELRVERSSIGGARISLTFPTIGP